MPASKTAVKETDENTEVIALKSKKGDHKTETITLFSIDGTAYGIPASIRPNQAMQIMKVFRKQGDTAGVDFMLEVLLGSEGYEALLAFDDLENDDLEKIIKIAFQMVVGATENPKAKN